MSLKYEKLIRKMTLAEKAVMMSGKNTWETVDFEKYGIPSMVMSDGAAGAEKTQEREIIWVNASLPALVFRQRQEWQTAGTKHLEKKLEKHLQRKQ